MKSQHITLASIVLSLVVSLAIPSVHADSRHTKRTIVTFNANLDTGNRQRILRRSGITSAQSLNLITAESVDLTDSEVSNLRHTPGVRRIEEDVVVSLERSTGPSQAVSPVQTVPWGINRVHAPSVWNKTQGPSIKVGVIDTGIDLNHPDLAADIKGSYNAIRPTRSAQDDNGHGTHVAGVIGALNNSVGVVGVGPKVDLYAIKVLSGSGTGYISDIIRGLDWAVAQHMTVINMSFGTPTDVTAFHDAVIRANKAGIVQVAAAGNDGKAVQYPGAYSEVITVAASDQSDKIASFSSRGSQVSITAPGVGIISTYPHNQYRSYSGTSMATPHVSGTVALMKSVCPTCSPETIKQKIQASADDIGTSGRDDQSGYGVINVEKALSQL